MPHTNSRSGHNVQRAHRVPNEERKISAIAQTQTEVFSSRDYQRRSSVFMWRRGCADVSNTRQPTFENTVHLAEEHVVHVVGDIPKIGCPAVPV